MLVIEQIFYFIKKEPAMPAKENDLPRKNADGYYRKDITFRGRKYAVRSKTLKGIVYQTRRKKAYAGSRDTHPDREHLRC